MCELGLKLDAEALDVIELGNGWPAEGYIYYVGARVAWESSASADKVRALVGKAQNVRQKPVQLNAEFRQETIQKMQSGATPAKRVINRLATPSKLLSTFKREQRRVFRLTAERDSQDEADSAGKPPPDRMHRGFIAGAFSRPGS